MAFYWFWEDVSPVRRLRDQYDELIDDLDYEIRRIDENIENIRTQINAIHKTLKSYSHATGCMAELYYEKISESEADYKKIISSCEDVLSTIKNRRRKAQQIRKDLQYYYRIEQSEDKQFSLGEIGL